MDEYYRGDTFIFPFSFKNENNSSIKYENEDVLKCGIKGSVYDSEYILFKELIVDKETDEVIFEFSSEETKNVEIGPCLLELKLTRDNKVNTIYQEKITIKGDVIR